MEILRKIWPILNIFTFVSAGSNRHFLQELISHHSFYSSKYNIIICSGHGNINLIKMLSERFQRFVTIYSEDEIFDSLLDEPQTFLLDLRCPKARKVLNQAMDLHAFSKPYEWLLLSEDDTYTTQYTTKEIDKNWFWPFLETLNILTDSNVRVIEKNSEQKITVTGVYKLQNSLIKEKLLEWTPNKGVTVLNSKTLVVRRWNLQGETLTSSLVLSDPKSLNNFRELMIKHHKDTTTKVSLNLVTLFQDFFNASMKFTIRKEWGVVINNSWTGMVGDLERKEVELAISPLFFLAERFHFLEYFASVNPTRMKFIFLSPPLSYSSNIFAMPFDTIVWCCCFGMVAVSCFLLFTAINYEKSHIKVEEEKVKDEKSKISFSEILVLNIGAICLQGTAVQTKDPPGRIITLFLYMSYLFLYISYSASIVAILQSSDTSIQTLADFLKSPLKAGAEDVAYSRHYFKLADQSKDEVRRAIYRTKIAPIKDSPNFLPIEDGIKKVRKGFYGYHVEVSLGYQVIQRTFTEEEKCALQELRDSFFQFPDPWVTMRKKSPYAELFKAGMQMAVERGFKSRFVRRFYTEKPICSSKSARFVSVGIFDCYYAFILLSSGSFAAFVIMLFEISFNRFLKRREKLLVRKNDFVPNLEFVN